MERKALLKALLLRKIQVCKKIYQTTMKQKQFDFDKFRQEQEAKKSAQKANNERVSEHKLLQTKIALEREEKARLNAMLNLSIVKHLVGLLLRRRTLQQCEYTEKELRLKANEQTIQRITDELAVLLKVEDPSEKLDADPEEEDE